MTDSDDVEQWARDCRGELLMDHENEVFLKFVLLANILGYEHVAYGLEMPTSLAEPSFSLFNNYTADWQQKFVERRASHHGSRVAYHKRTRPTAEHEKKYNWQRDDFEREARENRIKPEWLEQSKGEGGTIAFVAMAGRKTTCAAGFNQRVRILIDQTNERMRGLLLTKYLPQAYIKLSDVERTYLIWVLDGKTTGEIAEIMSLTKPAVENLQRKLPGRFEKTGIAPTAFLAYRLGLLEAPKAARKDES